MAIIDKIDKLSGTDTRSRNITQAIDKYSGKGPSKNIDDAVKKLDETGTLGKMGIKERIDHLSNAQTMSRDITQAIDRHTGKGPSKNIEEALKWWEEPTPPGPEPPVESEAYAVFDSADGSLVFFRDDPEKYIEGQIIDTKTYYTGIESGNNGWEDIASNIITATFNDAISPISTEAWFYQCINLISVNSIDNLDTSRLTTTKNMFFNAKDLDTLDLDNFDTSGITNMERMFFGCRDLTTTIVLRNQNTIYADMCDGAATNSNALVTLKYASPVTSDIVDGIISDAGSMSHIVNGGLA